MSAKNLRYNVFEYNHADPNQTYRACIASVYTLKEARRIMHNEVAHLEGDKRYEVVFSEDQRWAFVFTFVNEMPVTLFSYHIAEIE